MDLLRFCSNRIKRNDPPQILSDNSDVERNQPETDNIDDLLPLEKSSAVIKLPPDEFVNLGLNMDHLERIINLKEFTNDDEVKTTTLQDVYMRFVFPKTESSGQSYCEWLQSEDKDACDSVGLPSYLLVTPSTGTFMETMERLRAYFKSASNNTPVFVWMDIFSHRQPLAGRYTYMSMSGNALKTINNVLWAPGFTSSGVKASLESDEISLVTNASLSDKHTITVLLSSTDAAHVDAILHSHSHNLALIQKMLCDMSEKDQGGALRHVLEEWLFSYTTGKLRNQCEQEDSSQANNMAISKLRKICAQQHALRGDRATTECLLKTRWESNRQQLPLTEIERIGSLNDIAYFYRSRGEYNTAEPYFHERWEYRKQVLRSDHQVALSAQRDLANVMRLAGKYESAEELLVSCLESQVITLGSQHEETRITASDLSILYQCTAQFELLQQLKMGQYESAVQSLGADHAATLAAYVEVGDAFESSQQYTEAEEIYMRCFQMHEELFGEHYAETLIVLDKLAAVYTQCGKHTEAVDAYELSAQLHKQAYGDQHEQTAMKLASLAQAYSRVGRREDAVDTYLKVLQITLSFENDMVVTHKVANAEFSAHCSRALAREFIAQNQWVEAQHWLCVGLELCRVVDACDDMSRSGELRVLWLSIARDLSSVYSQRGDRMNSADTLACAIPHIKALLGANHSSTVQWVLETADLYKEVGTVAAYEATQPLYEECIQILHSESIQSEERSLLMMSAQLGLASLHAARARYSAAESLLNQLLNEKRDATTDGEVSIIQRARRVLISIYTSQNKWEAARVLLKEALTAARDTGESNADVLSLSMDLADILFQLGYCIDAERLYKECLEESRVMRGADHQLTVQLTHSLIEFYSRQCPSSDPCHCHSQKLESVDHLYRGLLDILRSKGDKGGMISTRQRLIELHAVDPAVDPVHTLRPLYIEQFTCLQERQSLLSISEPNLLIDEGLTISETIDAGIELDSNEPSLLGLSREVVNEIKVEASSDPCIDSAEVNCLRALLATYAHQDHDQYRWRRELQNALSVTHGPDHECTMDAMLDSVHWLRERHTSRTQQNDNQVDKSLLNNDNDDQDEKHNTDGGRIIAIPDVDGITELYRDCVGRTIRRVGTDSERTLEIQTHLATWYEAIQHWEEAEALRQEIRTATTRVHGEESERAKESAEALSAFYLRSGRPDPALVKSSKKKATSKKK